jgi:glycosyltransferase involved in cell wall biosynthesis
MVAACPFPANYGSPAAIREMSVTLAEMGHDVHVVTYPHGDDLPLGAITVHRAGRGGKPVRVGPTLDKPLLDLRLLFTLCRVIREERIDIIHAHNYEGALIGAVAKALTGRPLVYHAVNLMRDELHTYRFIRPAWAANLLARFLDWFTPRPADEIIALTPELEKVLAATGKRITMIPCGVQPAMFANANPAPIRRRHSLEGRRVVMYTGVNSAFQRIDYLLRAYALARQPDTVLMVVSPLADEPDLAASQALARELGLDVIWAGPHTLAELPDYLACADVTVVPRSDCPGHPIKLLNYMMAGKPAVCFAGAAKGVSHGKDAWVVPDHDWRALGEGIALLLADRELAARLGAQARRTATEQFDWRRLCERVEEVYDRVLENRQKIADSANPPGELARIPLVLHGNPSPRPCPAILKKKTALSRSK